MSQIIMNQIYEKDFEDFTISIIYDPQSLVVSLKESCVHDISMGKCHMLNSWRLMEIDKDFINGISYVISRKTVFDENYELIEDNQSSIYFENEYCSKYIAIYIMFKILDNCLIKPKHGTVGKNIELCKLKICNAFRIVTDVTRLTNYRLKISRDYFKNFKSMDEYDRIILLNAEENYSFIKPLEERITESVTLRVNERIGKLEARMDRLEATVNAKLDHLENAVSSLAEMIQNQQKVLLALTEANAKTSARLDRLENAVLPSIKPTRQPK